MSYEALLSVFFGAALVAIGFIALSAGIVLGCFGHSEHSRRAFFLVLTGTIGSVVGIWLMYAMS
jgi:hypothetical protein